jgi:hypothetical protein
LGFAAGGIVGWRRHVITFLCSLQTRELKVFVVERQVFGIIVLFESFSKRDCDSASTRRDTQPSPKS